MWLALPRKSLILGRMTLAVSSGARMCAQHRDEPTMRLTITLAALLLTFAGSCQCSKTPVNTLLAEPARLDFGKFAPSRTGDLEVTITNTSKSIVTLRAMVDGDPRGAFSVLLAPAQLGKGASAPVKVRYSAGAIVGPDNGMLVVSVSGGGDLETEREGSRHRRHAASGPTT